MLVTPLALSFALARSTPPPITLPAADALPEPAAVALTVIVVLAPLPSELRLQVKTAPASEHVPPVVVHVDTPPTNVAPI